MLCFSFFVSLQWLNAFTTCFVLLLFSISSFCVYISTLLHFFCEIHECSAYVCCNFVSIFQDVESLTIVSMQMCRNECRAIQCILWTAMIRSRRHFDKCIHWAKRRKRNISYVEPCKLSKRNIKICLSMKLLHFKSMGLRENQWDSKELSQVLHWRCPLNIWRSETLCQKESTRYIFG